MSTRSLLLASALLASIASRAHADDVTPTLQLEGGAQVMLTDSYRDRFDWGGLGFARAGIELIGPLALQLGVGTAWFPVPEQDPGNLYAFELGARGFFVIDRVAGGPFVDANVGVGITGDLVRLVFDVGLGWELLPLEWLGVGPVVRYQQIVQPDGEARPDDAHLLSFGLSVTARIDVGGGGDDVQTAAAPPAPVDTDADGLRDDSDRCPDLAEDADGVDDTDGCPEDDVDHDGLDDASDACPTAAEVRNGFQDDDGCPDEAPPPEPASAPPAAARGEPLSQEILFRVGSDRVSGRYTSELAEVCTLLRDEPTVRVRVIGHADEQGTAAANARLGAARAGAVAEQLVLCGVAPERIEAVSYGDTQPLCRDEASTDCHARNRRVTFELLRRE
ncbi:OmpA family protein [Sandaracinus amylolyticus]|uniref:Calcium-binding acidic-repeat protein n=1 Tax=Sandaracinus amylolyticus TaxID=927083 RepID=A0A0F6YLL8_9BACT|nr:OmpA family protein [Sandaracinus amylolyticus]AKF09338.1 Calcium-binding acidic-repeat protein [Sandaracinus amylolyticus]